MREIKYIKSAARLLDRVWVNKGGFDLSKEVLWVSVGLTKNSAAKTDAGESGLNQAE